MRNIVTLIGIFFMGYVSRCFVESCGDAIDRYQREKMISERRQYVEEKKEQFGSIVGFRA